MFATQDHDEIGFPHARCPQCERTVLLYGALDESGAVLHRCLDCGGEVPDGPEGLWADAEVRQEGYRIEGQETSQRRGSCGNCGQG